MIILLIFVFLALVPVLLFTVIFDIIQMMMEAFLDGG